MKEALILFAIGFVLSCWIFVVGHQLGLEFFERLAESDFGVFPIGYTITALTVPIIVLATVGAVFKR